MRFHRFLPVLALLCSAGPLAAQASSSSSARQSAVALRFGWPEELTARVEARRFQVRQSESTDTTDSRVSYTMRVRAHPEGRLVQYGDFRFLADSGVSRPGDEGDRLARLVGALVPSYVVSGEGEFVRVVDVEQLKARVDSIFTEPMREGHAPPEAAATLRSMLSEQALTGIAAQEWNAFVGTWIGADLVPGAKYEVEAEEPFPLLPGATVRMVNQFTLTRRLPCHAGAAPAGCVELRVRSTLEPGEVRRIIDQLLSRVFAGAAPPIESFDIESEIVLVAEPRTLLPHSLVNTRSMRGSMKDTATERGGSFSHLDRRTYRFTYLNLAGGRSDGLARSVDVCRRGEARKSSMDF